MASRQAQQGVPEVCAQAPCSVLLLHRRSMPYMELPHMRIADLHCILLVRPEDEKAPSATRQASRHRLRHPSAHILPRLIASSLADPSKCSTSPAALERRPYASRTAVMGLPLCPQVELCSLSELGVWVNEDMLSKGQVALLRDGDWICLAHVRHRHTCTLAPCLPCKLHRHRGRIEPTGTRDERCDNRSCCTLILILTGGR